MVMIQSTQHLIEDIAAQNKKIPYRVRFRTADMPNDTWSEYRPYRDFQQQYERVASAEFHFMNSYVNVTFDNGDYKISEPMASPRFYGIGYKCDTCER